MTDRNKHPAGAAPSDRRGGADPGPSTSLSSDGLPGELPTRSPGEPASVRQREEEEEVVVVKEELLWKDVGPRPADWVPELLPGFTRILDGTVSWSRYYDAAWMVEKRFEDTSLQFVGCAKLASEWEKYALEQERKVAKWKAWYIEMARECKKCKCMGKDKVGNYVCIDGGQKERSEKEMQVDAEVDLDGLGMDVGLDELGMDENGAEKVDMDRTIRAVETVQGRMESMERIDKLEREVSRMADAVALLAESLTLQGERLSGEMTTIRECVHAQWRMGGGLPLTSSEEEVSRAPPLSLPSVVCGAPQGDRPAGGGGRGGRKKRKLVVGEKTGVSPPSQHRRIGELGEGVAPPLAAGTPRADRPVRPPSPAVHPPVARGHPAGVRPSRPSDPTPPTRAAAVVIRGREEGFSYAEALRKAQKEVPLGDLGIPEVRARRTAGGDLLVEVRDPPSGGVDALVGRLSSLLPEASVKKVEASGEVRLVGFDESVLPDDLVKALAEAGGCAPSAIRVGVPRINRGTGSAWARLPLEAANIAARGGRLRVGWSVVRVSLLGRRPLQCFGCWGYGHVLASCPSTNMDRSRTCFRCGVAGHKASDCTARPFCAVCDGAGLYARHRMGGPSCELARRAAEGRGGRSGRRRGRPPNIGDRGRKGSGASGPPPS